MNYLDFIKSKSAKSDLHGFDPTFIPDYLFPFQKHLLEWSVKMGRAAMFADCGLGKTIMSLAWAQNVLRYTNKPVLILTPLSVTQQFVEEGEKFGIECNKSRDGKTHPITITNYQQLHKYDSTKFGGIVCDESSAIKNFKGQTSNEIFKFVRKIPYRLMATATAAPNDFIELGTHSEALGYMGYMDMLGTFFKNQEKNLHPAFIDSKFTFKPHAEIPFWKWVSSWAKAIRKPSDLGFSDDGYDLQPLNTNHHEIINTKPLPGQLFKVAAKGRKEQLEERRLTKVERCEKVAELASHKDFTVIWAHYNYECDMLEKMIPGSKQVSGSMSDDEKEETFQAFKAGEIKKLITKPKIGAWGLNWQHCNHMITFPSHSFEQYYQSVRRIYRFGQKRPVTVDVVFSEGEKRVFENLNRKREAAEEMFKALIDYMNHANKINNKVIEQKQITIPTWIQ